MRKDFLKLIGASRMSNVLASIALMIHIGRDEDDNPKFCWVDYLLNLVTLGVYGILRETRNCAKNKEMSNVRLGMKLCEATESAMSFVVNIRTLLTSSRCTRAIAPK